MKVYCLHPKLPKAEIEGRFMKCDLCGESWYVGQPPRRVVIGVTEDEAEEKLD